MNSRRITIAFILCVVTPCAVVAFLLSIDGSEALSVVGACAATIVLVAAPILLLVRRGRSIRAVDCLFAGALMATVPTLVLLVASSPHPQDFFVEGEPIIWDGAVEDVSLIFYVALFGACIGGLFWLIALKRPPHARASR
jgi:drug/metabolite transporter (DMT)-like permease